MAERGGKLGSLDILRNQPGKFVLVDLQDDTLTKDFVNQRIPGLERDGDLCWVAVSPNLADIGIVLYKQEDGQELKKLLESQNIEVRRLSIGGRAEFSEEGGLKLTQIQPYDEDVFTSLEERSASRFMAYRRVELNKFSNVD